LIDRAGKLTAIFVIIVLSTLALVALLASVERFVSTSGVVFPRYIVPGRSEVSGTVDRVAIYPGTSVNAGETLAVIRAPELDAEVAIGTLRVRESDSEVLLRRESAVRLLEGARARLEQARLSIPRAESKLESAIAEVAVFSQLARPDVTGVPSTGQSGSEHPTIVIARAELASARAQVAIDSIALVGVQRDSLELFRAVLSQSRSRIDLENAIVRKAQAIVRAPISGVVTSGVADSLRGRRVEKGQELFRVSTTDSWIVVIRVPETEVRRIRIGAKCVIRLRADRDFMVTELAGRVARISPSQSDQAGDLGMPTSGYEVIVELLAPAEQVAQLRSGFRATVRVATDRVRLLELLLQRIRG
jgi:multidrug resistance efflux pump